MKNAPKRPSIKHYRSKLIASRRPNGEITGEKQNRRKTTNPRSPKPPFQRKTLGPHCCKTTTNKQLSYVSGVANHTSNGESKPPIRNQHYQAEKPMEETQNLNQCNYSHDCVSGKSSGKSQTPIKNQTPGATNREKNVHHYILPSEKTRTPSRKMMR
jgi:hypothetical protein